MGKRLGPEEIIGKLREAEIILAKGRTTGDACRRIAVTEAKVLIEAWRLHYNTISPHSKLGYRPPAPETATPPLPSSGYATLHLQSAMAKEEAMY